MEKDSRIKTVISWVCIALGILLLCTTIVTCSLFGDDTGTEEIVDWKKICTDGIWSLLEYNAKHDTVLPTCLTTLSDITFNKNLEDYTVLIHSEDRKVGPFEFIFNSESTGTLTVKESGISLTLASEFTSFKGKRKLTLTLPDRRKIVFGQTVR